MVWRCMGWEGVGKLHLIEGIMNKHVYLDILQRKLMGTIHMQGLD